MPLQATVLFVGLATKSKTTCGVVITGAGVVGTAGVPVIQSRCVLLSTTKLNKRVSIHFYNKITKILHS